MNWKELIFLIFVIILIGFAIFISYTMRIKFIDNRIEKKLIEHMLIERYKR